MERNDIGTGGTEGVTDDVSFDRSKSAADGASTGIGGTSATATDDVSTTGAAAPVVDGKLAAAKQKIGAAKEKVVDRMHATADWIKERDIDQLKGTVEQQVRDHPGRTLLIAVGLGYLIGRAFRGGNSA